ncbi:MAG: HPr(Ser) kinase/phosphatase [Chlamydiota bacterium]
MYLVKDFYRNFQEELGLKLLVGEEGLKRTIRKPEAQRPGLSLSGYTPHLVKNRILIFGKTELGYLRGMEESLRTNRLRDIFSEQTPAVIVAGGRKGIRALNAYCKATDIPFFQSQLSANDLVAKIPLLLEEEFSPSTMMHGTLVEVFGMGVLIQGESSIGKSEAALGLIERGHRLISDDVVKVYKKEGAHLIGYGPDLTRHLMEIRGIGIINVAQIYGYRSVGPEKPIEILIKIEEWDNDRFYDRVGLEEKFCYILGNRIPFRLLPVKPGRDVVLLIETVVSDYRLKRMGYHAPEEFNANLLQAIAKRQIMRSMHEVRPGSGENT